MTGDYGVPRKQGGNVPRGSCGFLVGPEQIDEDGLGARGWSDEGLTFEALSYGIWHTRITRTGPVCMYGTEHCRNSLVSVLCMRHPRSQALGTIVLGCQLRHVGIDLWRLDRRSEKGRLLQKWECMTAGGKRGSVRGESRRFEDG